MSKVLVLRSVNLPADLDADLRQLAHDKGVSKSDLIRAAVALKVKEWRGDNTGTKLQEDVQAGLREPDRRTLVKKVTPAVISRKPRAQSPERATASPAAPTKGARKKAELQG